jgi:hypothetical protein
MKPLRLRASRFNLAAQPLLSLLRPLNCSVKFLSFPVQSETQTNPFRFRRQSNSDRTLVQICARLCKIPGDCSHDRSCYEFARPTRRFYLVCGERSAPHAPRMLLPGRTMGLMTLVFSCGCPRCRWSLPRPGRGTSGFLLCFLLVRRAPARAVKPALLPSDPQILPFDG